MGVKLIFYLHELVVKKLLNIKAVLVVAAVDKLGLQVGKKHVSYNHDTINTQSEVPRSELLYLLLGSAVEDLIS